MFTTIFIEPLFNLLFLLYNYLPGHDLGVAVIGLTVIVRLLLWPLVTRQLHSQRALQALAPEVAKIRKQAGGDRQKETQLLMELYKERKISPFAPIVPILLQMPIIFALFIVFKDAVDPNKIADLAYTAVERLPEISRILADHSLFSPSLFGLIDLTKPSLILAVLAGATQWYQAKMLQPKKEHMDQQARMMASLVMIFPVVTVVVGMTLPSALALYWSVTSIVAALQQHWVLRRDANEMEQQADQQDAKSNSKTAVAAEVEPAVDNQPTNPKTARKKARKAGRKGGAA